MVKTPEWIDVHRFWFGTLLSGGSVSETIQARWFKKSEAFDRKIRDNFALFVDQAIAGELEAWTKHARSALCLVLLCDQFTRNIYRDSARAFAGDALALRIARTLDADSLFPIERVFAFLPFEHSESPADQRLSLSLFSKLVDSVEASEAERFGRFRSYARRHAITP